jgi:hypothetical protein
MPERIGNMDETGYQRQYTMQVRQLGYLVVPLWTALVAVLIHLFLCLQRAVVPKGIKQALRKSDSICTMLAVTGMV